MLNKEMFKNYVDEIAQNGYSDKEFFSILQTMFVQMQESGPTIFVNHFPWHPYGLYGSKRKF
jgi:hypothetical protein